MVIFRLHVCSNYEALQYNKCSYKIMANIDTTLNNNGGTVTPETPSEQTYNLSHFSLFIMFPS